MSLLRDVEGRGQVGVEHVAPLLEAHLAEGRGRHVHARVVEEQVEPAVARRDRAEQRAHLRLACQVRGPREHLHG